MRRLLPRAGTAPGGPQRVEPPLELELPLLLGLLLGELGVLGALLVSDELPLEVLGLELGVLGVAGAFMSRRGSVSPRRPWGEALPEDCVALLGLFLQAPTPAIIPAAEARAIHLLRVMVVLSCRLALGKLEPAAIGRKRGAHGSRAGIRARLACGTLLPMPKEDRPRSFPASGGPRRAPPLREDLRLLTPRQIYEHLDRFVIGQTAAKRAVATAAHQHLKRIEQRRLGKPTLLRKSNVLLMGPTGSGKTHIARKLADLLEVPFTVADATEYTEAGYYGKDVEVMVAELLFKSGHSIDATQRGVIFIDEIDKIARRTGSARTGAGNRDIGGEGVQQALLKLLEGREIFVPLNVTQHWNKHDFVQVDTSDILFICAGTFTDLHEVQVDKMVGFGSSGRRMGSSRLRVRELIEYGMLAELLGRLPVQVQLQELTAEELYRILTEPPDALAREYREALAIDGVELDLQKSALEAIVEYSVEKKLGARALRSILEELLADVMFEAPERRGERLAIDRRYAQARLKKVDAAALKDG
jgi:ATP-dependent Clp protease ATP-binding subunit ClpX